MPPGKIMYQSVNVNTPSKKVWDMIRKITGNKANLRDLIAATGLVILLKIGFKSSIFCPCNLKIWWMTSKNNRAPHLYYTKHCASFQCHQWVQTGITVPKCSITGQNWWFFSCVTFKFDGWPWKWIRHLFYTTSSFVHHFKAIGEFKLELKSESAQFGPKIGDCFGRVTSKFDGWPLKYNREPLLWHFKLCASFHRHL